MKREQRAKQFAPFDPLKGLRDALRVKEYEHESIIRGEISEDDTVLISKTFVVTFFELSKILVKGFSVEELFLILPKLKSNSFVLILIL